MQTLLDQLDPGEKVIFSCIVVKINKWTLFQDRTLLLTDQNLYNVKKDTVKRKIKISSIKALTMSTLTNYNEFVVHIKSEYDYRYLSDYRREIFDAIKYIWWKVHKTNLPIYGVPQKLKDFHTSKKDIAAGCEICPPPDHKLSNEDIYPVGDQPKAALPIGVTDDDFNMGNEVAKSIFQRSPTE